MSKIVENLWVVGAPPRTSLGELTAISHTPYLVGRGLLSLPNNSTPAIGLDFRPFGPHLAASPNSLNPQILRGLDKTLYYAILRKIHLDPHGEGTPHTLPDRGLWSLSTLRPTSEHLHTPMQFLIKSCVCSAVFRIAQRSLLRGERRASKGTQTSGKKNNFY